jgi:hypothetical protein
MVDLFSAMHEDIERRLTLARRSFGHPTVKGDATENVWSDLLSVYLPKRYQIETAHIVDSDGEFSEQIDIVVFDRQYSPFIFHFQGQAIVPSESVYAVFEAKQSINASQVAYAQKKLRSVRRLRRTSLPIPHAGGTYPPKIPSAVLGGLLTLDSDWAPTMGQPLIDALNSADTDNRLDLGCVASHGIFWLEASGDYSILSPQMATTVFLFDLIARLQEIATAPMIDIRAYGRWLK